MWINSQSMLVCPLGLTLVAQIFQKVACFWSSPNFYPNLPIFLHGYIRHIRDIFHLWGVCVCTCLCVCVCFISRNSKQSVSDDSFLEDLGIDANGNSKVWSLGPFGCGPWLGGISAAKIASDQSLPQHVLS